MTNAVARLVSLLRVAAMAALALTTSARSFAQARFTEFDVPGAGTGAYQGTAVSDTNAAA
jgi:hypothetical protein